MMLQRVSNCLSIFRETYKKDSINVVLNLKDENQKNNIIGMIAQDSEIFFRGDAYKKYGIEKIVYKKKHKPKAIFSLCIINYLDNESKEKIPNLEDMHILFSKKSDLIISDNSYFCKKILEEKCVKEEYLINLEDALIEQ